MNKYLYIKEINYKINKKISRKLYWTARIIGEKKLLTLKKALIVELEDYSRIWMLPEEIKIINQQQGIEII